VLHLLRGGEQLLHIHLAALIQCGPHLVGSADVAPGRRRRALNYPDRLRSGTLSCRFEPTASPTGQLPRRPGA
jgi:hypothetical protein